MHVREPIKSSEVQEAPPPVDFIKAAARRKALAIAKARAEFSRKLEQLGGYRDR